MEKYIKGNIRITPLTYVSRETFFDDNIICFDLEAFTGWVNEHGNIVPFDYSKPKEFYKDKKFVANSYIWQCSLANTVYYGRHLELFKDFVDELMTKIKGQFVIWVHNLSYEFQWLCNLFEWDEVFARKAHKVIYCRYKNVEFRCSYMLTRLSLAKWATEKKLSVNKLSGDDFIYDIKRTPLTPLFDYELDYCEHDCLVMYEGLKEYRNKYKHVHSIPLTQTGEVRKVLKQATHKNKMLHVLCSELVPNNYKEYALMRQVFWGAYTHANYSRSGVVLKDVRSKDLTSAYPAVMVNHKYPMTKWRRTSDYRLYRHNDNYSLILNVTFTNFESITFNNYVSKSKCYECKGDIVIDNGRVSYADILSIVLTNVDLDILENSAVWDYMIVRDCYVSCNKYLPIEIVNTTLLFFQKKNELKDTEFFSLYMSSKEQLNSVYGCMVTAQVNEDIIFNQVTGEWPPVDMDENYINAKLKEKKEKIYKNYLAYQWGIFITAYVRAEIWKIITSSKEMDMDTVYCDTDSIKYVNDHEDVFRQFNDEVIQLNADACEYHGIDVSLTQPRTKKGSVKILGTFDTETTADEFITLGAKRYAAKYGDDLKITVSGVNKEYGVKALKGDINNFNEKLVFDYKECKKMIMGYVNDQPFIDWGDGYTSTYRYVITGIPTTYSMTLDDEYLDLILGIRDFSDNFEGMTAKQLHDIVFAGEHKKGKR